MTDGDMQGSKPGFARFKGATVLFLYSSKADPYLTHRTSVQTYSAAYARAGIGAIALDITGADFSARLAEIAPRADVIAIHCEQSWGLDLVVERNGHAADMFELLNKPAIAHIRDYPFYPWLRTRTLVPKRNRLLFFTEKSAVDFVAPFLGRATAENVYSFAPHIYLQGGDDPEPLPTYQERLIDLLYVGSYADPMVERAKFVTAQPGLAGLLDAVIDAAVDEHGAPFWKIAYGVTKDRGLAPDHSSAVYLDLLVAANQFIRNERRRRLLAKLAPHKMHLVWSGPKPDVQLHPDTVVAAGNTLPETLSLCRQAKAMAMCLNSFPYSLSERLLSAMDRGAAVVCAPNAMIEDTFSDGDTILTLDAGYNNVDEQVARLRDPSFGAALTARAQEKVRREFSPDVRVGQFISAIAQFYEART